MEQASFPLYATAQIRAVEQAALVSVPAGTLMARAGAAAADLALRILGSAARKRVLVLAGPGNNGGDALIAASRLAGMGARTSVMPLFEPEAPRPGDARQALELCKSGQSRFIPADPGAYADDNWDLVIDGLFGIGVRRNLDERTRAVVCMANALPCPLLALDVPTGLDADTGTLVDEQGHAIVATHTITFLGDKPGLHTGYGRDRAGEVTVADLGVAGSLYPQSQLHLAGIATFQSALRRRRQSSHKGTYGDVAIAGGAAGMTGGALLAARAAIHAGAGRVYAVLLDRTVAYDGQHPELMLRVAAEFEFDKMVIVAGPGMGKSSESRALLARTLAAAGPIVLDADALNMIAADASLQEQVARHEGGAVITPHPLEAARLLECETKQIQANRIEAARELARRFGCVALLKGSGTVIAAPDGEAVVNPTGNPALATAGTGDVLSGLCGALLGQGYGPWHAAVAAAWLHGAAADRLVSHGTGPIGVTASELIVPVRSLLNELTAKYAS